MTKINEIAESIICQIKKINKEETSPKPYPSESAGLYDRNTELDTDFLMSTLIACTAAICERLEALMHENVPQWPGHPFFQKLHGDFSPIRGAGIDIANISPREGLSRKEAEIEQKALWEEVKKMFEKDLEKERYEKEEKAHEVKPQENEEQPAIIIHPNTGIEIKYSKGISLDLNLKIGGFTLYSDTDAVLSSSCMLLPSEWEEVIAEIKRCFPNVVVK